MSSGFLNGLFALDKDSEGLYEMPNHTGTPERNLLMAILERAILDLVGNDPKESEDAETWLFGDLENPTYSEFSFPWLCQELDLEYAKTAAMIRGIPKRGDSRIAPWYLTKNYAQHAC